MFQKKSAYQLFEENLPKRLNRIKKNPQGCFSLSIFKQKFENMDSNEKSEKSDKTEKNKENNLNMLSARINKNIQEKIDPNNINKFGYSFYKNDNNKTKRVFHSKNNSVTKMNSDRSDKKLQNNSLNFDSRRNSSDNQFRIVSSKSTQKSSNTSKDCYFQEINNTKPPKTQNFFLPKVLLKNKDLIKKIKSNKNNKANTEKKVFYECKVRQSSIDGPILNIDPNPTENTENNKIISEFKTSLKNIEEKYQNYMESPKSKKLFTNNPVSSLFQNSFSSEEIQYLQKGFCEEPEKRNISQINEILNKNGFYKNLSQREKVDILLNSEIINYKENKQININWGKEILIVLYGTLTKYSKNEKFSSIYEGEIAGLLEFYKKFYREIKNCANYGLKMTFNFMNFQEEIDKILDKENQENIPKLLTTGNTIVLKINLNGCLQENLKIDFKRKIDVLEWIPFIQNFNNDELFELSQCFKTKSYELGQFLIRENTQIKSLFIIAEGTCKILKNPKSIFSKNDLEKISKDYKENKIFFEEVGYLQKTNYFGQSTIISEEQFDKSKASIVKIFC